MWEDRAQFDPAIPVEWILGSCQAEQYRGPIVGSIHHIVSLICWIKDHPRIFGSPAVFKRAWREGDTLFSNGGELTTNFFGIGENAGFVGGSSTEDALVVFVVVAVLSTSEKAFAHAGSVGRRDPGGIEDLFVGRVVFEEVG